MFYNIVHGINRYFTRWIINTIYPLGFRQLFLQKNQKPTDQVKRFLLFFDLHDVVLHNGPYIIFDSVYRHEFAKRYWTIRRYVVLFIFLVRRTIFFLITALNIFFM